MDDIEDFHGGVEVGDARISERSLIFPKKFSAGNNHEEDVESYVASVPGTQKVWVKTFGCSHNVSDSEYMVILMLLCCLICLLKLCCDYIELLLQLLGRYSAKLWISVN